MKRKFYKNAINKNYSDNNSKSFLCGSECNEQTPILLYDFSSAKNSKYLNETVPEKIIFFCSWISLFGDRLQKTVLHKGEISWENHFMVYLSLTIIPFLYSTKKLIKISCKSQTRKLGDFIILWNWANLN